MKTIIVSVVASLVTALIVSQPQAKADTAERDVAFIQCAALPGSVVKCTTEGAQAVCGCFPEDVDAPIVGAHWHADNELADARFTVWRAKHRK